MSVAIPWILFLATACALVLAIADARGYHAELMRVGGELAKELERARQGIMDRCGRCRFGLCDCKEQVAMLRDQKRFALERCAALEKAAAKAAREETLEEVADALGPLQTGACGMCIVKCRNRIYELRDRKPA